MTPQRALRIEKRPSESLRNHRNSSECTLSSTSSALRGRLRNRWSFGGLRKIQDRTMVSLANAKAPYHSNPGEHWDSERGLVRCRAYSSGRGHLGRKRSSGRVGVRLRRGIGLARGRAGEPNDSADLRSTSKAKGHIASV